MILLPVINIPNRVNPYGSQIGSNLQSEGNPSQSFKKVLGYKVLNPAYDPIYVHKENQEILQIFQETGDRWLIAHALHGIANETAKQGEFDERSPNR